MRSEQIIKKQGLPRPVAIKASVVNKIVREASGNLHIAITRSYRITYTFTNQPRNS